MQITLKQSEIEAALKAFVQSQGISLFNKSIAISFTAGRKESGISAEIDIDEVESGMQAPVISGLVLRGQLQSVDIGQLPDGVQAMEATVLDGSKLMVNTFKSEDAEPVEETKTTSLFG